MVLGSLSDNVLLGCVPIEYGQMSCVVLVVNVRF